MKLPILIDLSLVKGDPMKSKAAVVALCVCVILAVLGVVHRKKPGVRKYRIATFRCGRKFCLRKRLLQKAKLLPARGFDTCKSHDAQRKI